MLCALYNAIRDRNGHLSSLCVLLCLLKAACWERVRAREKGGGTEEGGREREMEREREREMERERWRRKAGREKSGGPFSSKAERSHVAVTEHQD